MIFGARDYVFHKPKADCWLMASFEFGFLSAACGGNQLRPDPFRFGHAGRFYSRHDFIVFWRRNPRGNEPATLFLFRECGSADFGRFGHISSFSLGF
ncbi:MAG: hypothetical protein ABSF60_09615 [Verrucomicrobiota bacterium]|jgi:hypothetical protein